MRGRLALVLALWVGAAAGCTPVEKVSSTSWLPRLPSFQGPVGPDVVQMEVALLERPLGDPYINKDLWQFADERVVGPDRKAVMEGSGFRIGQVSGRLTPSGLLALLTSKRCCANPRALRVHAGHPTPLELGPALPVCRFQIDQDGQPVTAEFAQAQCRLVVVPSLAGDGKTVLRFTPQVVHGAAAQVYRVTDDHTGLTMVTQRPTQDYPDLSWEATLAPDEYLVVGGCYDKPGTLGHQSFVRPDEAPPVQRLLVVRAGPLEDEPKVPAPPAPGAADKDDPGAKAPPLALQAAWPAARGAAP
jgi:hypothetical protein